MEQRKILIIDDDRVLVQILGRRISAAGYEVLTAFDGVQGLKLAFHENPSLIILDIMFPAGGGIEILKKLSSSTKTWNIPIIINTGHDDPQFKQTVSQYNIVDFMLKPVDPEKIVQKIKEVLKENPK